ncbi:MAG: nuclear transport factor 2 family protein [Acidimicrobiia bacterium]|nr:nuclear transport factor 2 family protein [Acidimicrobiia bacterium]
MIETTIARWHQHLRGELPGGLDELLHDDVVFFSPVVFTPQRGKAVTKMYLEAAGATLGGEPDPAASDGVGSGGGSPAVGGKFRYVSEVMSGNRAVLEFETEMSGKYINGVDLITCDDDGKIIEFKVMIRPLQAINALHEAMRAMLEQMQ